MLDAIITDFEIILTSKKYESYLSQFKIGANTSRYRKIKNKLKLLLPWYKKFTELSIIELEEEIRPVLLSAFKNIENYSKILITYSRFDKQNLSPSKKMQFFETRYLLNKNIAKSGILDTIGEDLLQKKESLPEAVKAWYPSDTVQFLLPTPAPGYASPNQLPIPKNDWTPKDHANLGALIQKSKRPIAYPTPNPDYKAPKNLPTPKNDWLIE